MRSGVRACAIFAALWATGGVAGLHLPRWLLPVPALLSAALIARSWRRPLPDRAGDAGRVRRLVAIWSGVEVLAILVAAGLLGRTGHVQAIVPVIVMIVGLHFLPLARGLPVPAYYATGAAMAVAGLMALALQDRAALAVATFGASLALWATAAWLPGTAAGRGRPAT